MIDLARARQLLKDAMETQGPDFIYIPEGTGGCFYTPITELPRKYPREDGSRDIATDDPRRKTGCIVGVALDLAGETRHHTCEGRVDSLRAQFPDMMTDEACWYFNRAQNLQDMGRSWGYSYGQSESYAEKYLTSK